jgi:hypothetical protein
MGVVVEGCPLLTDCLAAMLEGVVVVAMAVVAEVVLMTHLGETKKTARVDAST